MRTKTSNSNSLIIRFGQWFVAIASGWVIGNWIASYSISSLLAIVTSPVNPQSLSGLLISSSVLAMIRGIFIGLFIGLFQWAIEKRYGGLPVLWILANVLGWSFAFLFGSWVESAIFQAHSIWLITEGVPELARYTSIGLCGRISLGILQSSLIKKHLDRSIAWLWINTISWSTPFIIFVGFTYIAFIFPRNHEFFGLTSTHYGFSASWLTSASFAIYDSIGVMAGAITSLMLAHGNTINSV